MNRNELIFNRTQADIDMALALMRQNIPLPADNLKIAWDWRALQRIELFSVYLADLFNSIGYLTPISAKTDWSTETLNSEVEGNRVLTNIRTLRKEFAAAPTLPQVPESSSLLNFSQVNDIERILFDIDVYISNMLSVVYRTGTIRTGQVKLRAKRIQ